MIKSEIYLTTNVIFIFCVDNGFNKIQGIQGFSFSSVCVDCYHKLAMVS